jgi:hypothetical protein
MHRQKACLAERWLTCGRPGEVINTLPVRSVAHPFGRPIEPLRFEMLQRPIESTQYTSVDFGKRCTEMGVRPSMGSVGDAYDNAMAESFFASLECELIDRRVWKSFAQARMEIFTWIEGWYNPRRRHSGLGQKSPANFEREQAARATRGRRGCNDGLPNGCFAPVDKPPQGSMKGPSACPQASPLDNPAPEHAHTIRDQPE